MGPDGETTCKDASANLPAYPYALEAMTKLIEEQSMNREEIAVTTAPMGTEFAVISGNCSGGRIDRAEDQHRHPRGALPALISDPGARKGSNLFYTSWYVSSGNPIGTFSILRTDNLSNYGNRSVPELDGIVNKPLGAMDSGSVSLGQ
ncbi:hypothetical protein AFL94_14575 [Arthrobacter sp. LS16]|nr:hypothetical protein AFL94_14575 [Arthrobacter sp. LS16]